MGSSEPIAIGSQHQLFLDDYLIDSADNVRREMNAAAKHAGNPVLKPEHPWEVSALLFGSVLKDASNGYRMWYYSRDRQYRYPFVNHAVSADGIRWEKPVQDQWTLDGQPTAVVFGPDHTKHMHESYNVIFDEAEADDSKRYKLIYNVHKKDETSSYREPIMRKYKPLIDAVKAEGHDDLAALYERWFGRICDNVIRTLGTAVSPDGIRWSRVSEFAVKDIWDIAHLTYDPYRKRYLIYGRDYFVPVDVHLKYKHEEWYQHPFAGRSVQVVESADFEHWTEGKMVLSADIDDLPCDEIYSMAVFPYEGLYIGLVQMFHAHPGERTLDIQLAVSRDGHRWTRAGNRQPFIPLGGIGEWDRFNHSVASAPVAVGDELRFYYSGRMYRHPSRKQYSGTDWGPSEPICAGFAGVRRDRFVSVEASFDGGTLVTKPVVFAGSRLHLNAACRWGRIRISLLDDAGRPVEGAESVEVSGSDAVDIEAIPEAGALARVAGRPVKIKFELFNAKLYSFWVD